MHGKGSISGKTLQSPCMYSNKDYSQRTCAAGFSNRLNFGASCYALGFFILLNKTESIRVFMVHLILSKMFHFKIPEGIIDEC